MNDQKTLLEEWYRRIAVTQVAHYYSADHFGAKKYWLGVPTVILTTMVGTSVFAAMQKQPEPWMQILVGLASVAAALLASLQTFLGYAERAEKHRVAGAKYGALGREIEQIRSSNAEAAPDILADLRRRLDGLSVESPNNPLKIYRKAGATDIEVLPDKFLAK